MMACENSAFLGLRPNPAASGLIEAAGIVCPECFRPVQHYSLFGPGEDGFGRKRRVYFGHCLECGRSAEVQQYEVMGQWVIHRYQIDQAGEWIEVTALPEPVVVMTGPGGDYLNRLTDHELIELLDAATVGLERLGQFANKLRKALHVKQHS